MTVNIAQIQTISSQLKQTKSSFAFEIVWWPNSFHFFFIHFIAYDNNYVLCPMKKKSRNKVVFHFNLFIHQTSNISWLYGPHPKMFGIRHVWYAYLNAIFLFGESFTLFKYHRIKYFFVLILVSFEIWYLVIWRIVWNIFIMI